MSKILWDYAVQLEYGDAIYLRALMEEVTKQLARNSPRTLYTRGHVEWRATQSPLSVSAVEFEFAQRLQRIGLVEIEQLDGEHVAVAPRRDFVLRLLEFLWADPAGTGELAPAAAAPADGKNAQDT